VILNKKEQNCIRFLAKCFSENKVFIKRDWAIEHMRVDDVTYETLIRKMEHIGAIENVTNVMGKGGYGYSFRISAHAEELARQLQRTKASPDIVEQLKERAQRNPLTAWLIIMFLILALLVPLLNSLWELLGKIMSFFSGE